MKTGKNITLGKKGEEIALHYLANKGHKILCTNWRWGKKELDLVTEKDDLLVVVEVKTRSNGFEDPREAITKTKQRRIVQATDAFVSQYNIQKEVRFDVVTVEFMHDVMDIEHIEDAFYPLI